MKIVVGTCANDEIATTVFEDDDDVEGESINDALVEHDQTGILFRYAWGASSIYMNVVDASW